MSVLSRWQNRLAIRRRLLARAEAALRYWNDRHERLHRESQSPLWGRKARDMKRAHEMVEDRTRLVEKRREQVAYATRVVQRHRRKRPKIITARDLGLQFSYPWGQKGTPYRGTGHYSASPRARDADALASVMRSFHAGHHAKGWGGLSYEALVADDGTIGFGNPMDRKSAAVAYNNTGMVNICCPGTTGDTMTEAQRESVRWLLDNWHTNAVPVPHRLPRPARELQWRGHREWPNNATACPGDFLADYHRLWR